VTIQDVKQLFVSTRWLHNVEEWAPKLPIVWLGLSLLAILMVTVWLFVVPTPGWFRAGLLVGLYMGVPVLVIRAAGLWNEPASQRVTVVTAAVARAYAEATLLFLLGSCPVWLGLALISNQGFMAMSQYEAPFVLFLCLAALGAPLLLHLLADLLDSLSAITPQLRAMVDLFSETQHPGDAAADGQAGSSPGAESSAPRRVPARVDEGDVEPEMAHGQVRSRHGNQP
jgi:hypothetical protein